MPRMLWRELDGDGTIFQAYSLQPLLMIIIVMDSPRFLVESTLKLVSKELGYKGS